MAPDPGRRREGFHEFPLVLFTALAIAGAGLGTGHITLSLFGWTPWVPPQRILGYAGALLGLGLLVSAGHLGRPMKGPFALFRVGKSPLSNEVVMASLATAASLSCLGLTPGGMGFRVTAIVALASSVLTLLSLGLVYRLHGQLSWAGFAPVHPLLLGIGFGVAALLKTLPEGAEARGEVLLLLVLFADGLLVWERTRRIGRSLAEGIPVQPRFMAQRGVTLSLRIVLGVLAPACVVLLGQPGLAMISLSLNLLLDRFLFYGLAVRETTESEIMRVESVLSERVT